MKPDAIISLLHEKGFVHHIDMTEALRLGRAEILYASEQAVVLRHRCGTAMSSVFDVTLGDEIAQLLSEASVVVSHQEWMTPHILKAHKKPVSLDIVTWQTACMRSEPWRVDTDIVLRPFTTEDFPFLQKHATLHDSTAYVKERLKSGNLWAAVDRDEVIGTIGTHAEGAMGFLEVFPQHRRKGYAEAITKLFINHVMKQGVIPYSQIAVGNEPSRKLHVKLGFEITGDNETLSWFL